MKRQYFVFALVALFFTVVLQPVSWISQSVLAQPKSVAIKGIRFGSLSNGQTRIVLDTTGPLNLKMLMLADPYRLVLDLPKTSWSDRQKVRTTGLVKSYRHSNFSSQIYRLVLDLKSPAIVSNHFYLAPRASYGHRYVIDVKSASRKAFLAAAKKTMTAGNKKTASKKSYKKSSGKHKKVIVLDPGHGGRDPGTLGRYGAHEAVLTLKIAQELKKQLEATGQYKVYLTRNNKKALHSNKSRDLRLRYEVARKRNADLFISIHVDAVDNPKTRGGSIYTLSERASDKEAARLVAKENKQDIIVGIDLGQTDKQVSNILIELAQRETLNYSAQFAEVLAREMRKNVKMLKTAHRFGPLMVLKAPDIPSVLIETGYQTNKQDATLLNSNWGRKRLARSIKNGIDAYFKTVKTSLAAR